MDDFEKEKIRAAEKNFGRKVYARKLRDLEGGFKIAILFGCAAILLIIFCFDAKWIEKFHVSATVVIAAVACMLQYSTHQERKLRLRESRIMKFCEGIVATIHGDKIMEKEEDHFNIFGDDGKTIKSTSQRLVCVDCQFVYSKIVQKSYLTVSVRVSKDKEGKKYDDYFQRIRYIVTPATRFLMSERCYGGSTKELEGPIVPVPVEVSSYSNLEWYEMTGVLSHITESLAIDGVGKTMENHQNSLSNTQQKDGL